MKKDCFAYFKQMSGRECCSALTEPWNCEKCKFYKEKETYEKQRKEARLRLYGGNRK